MCGIAGFLAHRGCDADGASRIVTAMTDAIRHRGPDDAGAWLDAPAGIVLGHRRLSILDLSPLGHQPMSSASGRFVLSFNGEIYNFRALRAELQAIGHRFRGGSDTEVMLAAFEAWGVRGAVEQFNGMFAFAVWDRERRALHLVRDRAGEKPLYYGWMGGTLLFGSELKALRAHPAFEAERDRGALALYLRYGFIPAPYTIYRGVHKLPPASMLTVTADARDAAPEEYWSAQAVAADGIAMPFTGTEHQARAHLDALLRDAVRIRMESDVPLGAFLSGGVDSSMIVALMQAESSHPVRTFTIGFNESAYDEASFASAVARHLGTEHTELYVTPREALGLIPRLPALYDEPFADPSQIPTFLVAELTRRHVTVSLSGDAGDELFGGYPRYAQGRAIWRAMNAFPAPVRRAAAAALDGASALERGLGEPLGRAVRRWTGKRSLAERARQGADVLRSTSPEALYRYMSSYWKDPTLLLPGAVEPAVALTSRERWLDLPDVPSRLMHLDLHGYLPDDILVKVDRASMAVSLESRIPLLDHRIIAFAWSLPLGWKLRGRTGKWLLRQLLHQYVPRRLVERPKRGFGAPVGAWLRGPLREWADDLLGERSLREAAVLDPRPIRRKWEEHIAGRTSWDYDLWTVLMFQAWEREYASPPAMHDGRGSGSSPVVAGGPADYAEPAGAVTARA
jgi:asparagine synthase (glutamine-hydrolysing)